ncbi:type IV pilus modification protein PilV [Pseudoduganella lutea]|uniref:Type IV pilus modification protein PilV n=1 Tax=Pseudoduganella lutea TaxID=321985 RepID=A0A4P6KUJ4_9BURK|nr:type IV pilus modification protein PilV [Pseudoduganella lutea]QBE62394.1 type IV pilus modification protein PilV [Pseudoduganella lutea]
MRDAAGFTLVEVLVALLVLGAGMVGGMAMQLHAMRTRHESALLSASTQLAVAMADRMRANAGQVTAIYLGVDYDAHAAPVPAAPDDPCRLYPCDPARIARLDIHELERQVRATLPAGRARICRDAQMYVGGQLRWECSGGPDDPIVVKIGWRGRHPDGTPRRDGGRGAVPGVAIVVAGVRP